MNLKTIRWNEQTLLFDMDGLLIDSEPVWREVEHAIFAEFGVSLTSNDFQQTMGMRIDQVIETHVKAYGMKVKKEVLLKRILTEMEKTIRKKGENILLPGVKATIDKVKTLNIRCALASSSPMQLIKATLETLKFDHVFDVVCSAETEEYGKPHPGVFLSAAKKLDAQPSNCIVLEDSFNGLLAAKSASMRCIVVPAKEDKNRKEWVIADAVLNDLNELAQAML